MYDRSALRLGPRTACDTRTASPYKPTYNCSALRLGPRTACDTRTASPYKPTYNRSALRLGPRTGCDTRTASPYKPTHNRSALRLGPRTACDTRTASPYKLTYNRRIEWALHIKTEKLLRVRWGAAPILSWLGFGDGHFFMRCDGDVKFSTMMRYWLFLDIPYHHHCCDYFPKSSGLIILFVWFWGFGFFGGFILGLLEVLRGFLRDLGFFWWVLEVLRGFQGDHHHCCNYFFEPSGPINLQFFWDNQ